MDKIYTRKRLRLPWVRYVGFTNNRRNDKKRKLTFQIICILIIAIITLITVINSIEPILDQICKDAAKAKATIISNNMATEVMKRYSYEDFIKIHRGVNGNVSMLQSDIVTINEVTSDVAVKIQEALISDDESITDIKLGSFTGIRILSGLGPDINIKFIDTGTVETKVRSEFESTGINQTIHRIYLDVKCKVSMLTPYNTVEETITNEILLAENVIVGLVPSTYYNLEGMDKDKLVDIIE